MVLSSLAENDLSLDLANSFLVIASKSSVPLNDDKYLAWHFSTHRRKAYCMKTEFIRTSTEQIRVKKSKLSDLTSKGLLTHNFSEEVEYTQGRKLSFELMQVLSLNAWKHADLASIFNKFYEYLLQFNVSPGQNYPPILLGKNLIDLIPRNIIIDADENLHAIDDEWRSDSSVDLRQVLFRSILSLPSLSILALDESGKNHSVKSLFFLVCDLLKIECSEVLFQEFSQTCVDYQKEISGYSGSLENFSEFTDSHFGRARFEPNLIIRKNLERDSAVAERDSAVAERDSVLNSTIWMLFKPYRKLKNKFLN
jgi:hypothetical protein